MAKGRLIVSLISIITMFAIVGGTFIYKYYHPSAIIQEERHHFHKNIG